MAKENPILSLSYPADEDLSNDQYRIVVLSGGSVRRPDSEAELSYGVLQNRPGIGEAAAVMVIGISKIWLGETVAENEWIKHEYNSPTDAGKGLDADGALDLALGRCLKGGDEDELGEILLSGTVHQVNIAS